MMAVSVKAGDKVGIVSTARKISLPEIQEAIAILQSWGLQVMTGETIGAEQFQFAGDDELRRDDLQQMLNDDSIKAILFARGGYGTARIIDELDWRKFLKNPKWLCGFSDITVIQSHLTSVYDMPSAHSLMAFNFKTAVSESIESLRKVLFGERLQYDVARNDLNRSGTATGILCGGNLSVLCSIAGSASNIDTDEKILFLEDIDEHLYHIDRMIVAMKRAGKLENPAGMIVGHFTDMKNNDENNPFGKSAYEIIAEHVAEYDYPVAFGFPAGHASDNRAVVIGTKWKLEVGNTTVFEMI